MQLVIVNGACGVGKSTLAKALHEQMPLSFLLDIDAQRRFISGYREHKDDSRALAMAVSQGIVETCMKAGRDVILERMLFHADTLDAFREIGARHGAQIHELILWAPKATVMQRALVRAVTDRTAYSRQKSANAFGRKWISLASGVPLQL